EGDPQQAVPERADLPDEVRLEPGAAHLAALQVVDDDGGNRRPSEEERADDRGRGDEADDQARGVQRVDGRGPADELVQRRVVGGRGGHVWGGGLHGMPPDGYYHRKRTECETTVGRSGG